MLFISVAYLINLIVCAHFEDKYFYNTLEFVIGQDLQPGFFLVFDVIKMVLIMIYIGDNMAYACTYGLKKRARIFNLSFEALLISVITALSVIEIVDTSIRFKAFYMRLLDITLLYRKFTVSQMLF